jgi:multimeric flavodoxin WrbA
MTMYIIGIVGSPRQGNTEFIVKEALALIGQKGFKTRLITLRELEFGHCRACWKCYKQKQCQLDDDMTRLVLPEMLSCQGMILGSPSFYGSVTGLMKNFMDRCTPFLNSYQPGPLRGKPSANLIVHGRAGGVYVAQATLDYWCLTMGMKVVHNSLLQLLRKDDAGKSSHLENEIQLIARKLLEEIDENRRSDDSENYPRLLVSHEAITVEWRTPKARA